LTTGYIYIYVYSYTCRSEGLLVLITTLHSCGKQPDSHKNSIKRTVK